jgi:tetratricopeptide (TPR) repeat protein
VFAAGGLLPEADAPLPATPEATIAEGTRVVEALAAAFPSDPDALEVLARCHLLRGSTAAAVATWKKCLALNPRYAYACAGLGAVALRRGDHREAAQWFRQAVEFAPRAFAFREDLADALINAGQVDEAIAVLTELIRSSPRSARAFDLLGMAYAHAGRHAEAKQSYRQAARLDPHHAGIRLGLANALARLGETEEARKCMDEFRRLRDEERKRRQTDLRQYNDLAAVRAEFAQLYTSAAQVFHAHGKADEAETLWRRSAAMDPTAIACRQALAWRSRQVGKLAETIRLLEELSVLEPANPSYDLEIARLRVDMNQLAEAEAALQRLCRRSPELADGHVALARLYLKTGRQPDEAVAAARRAADLAPSAAHWALVAEACQAAGDVPGAASAMEKALALDPGNLELRERYEQLRAKK